MSNCRGKKGHGAKLKAKTALQWQSDDCASDPLYFLRIQDVWKEITKEANIDDIRYLKLKKDVRIAVLDTGIYENHEAFKENKAPQPSLQTEGVPSRDDGDGHGFEQAQVAVKSRVVERENFVPDTLEINGEEFETDAASDLTKDENGHGTFCAALCAGGTFQPIIQDEAAIQTHSLKSAPFASAKKCILFETDFHCGVAPFAKLLNGKVASSEWDADLCKSEWLAQGIDWATEKKADIISISIGLNHFDEELHRAVNEALKKGVIIVCAASNDGRKERNCIQYPARLGNVLCVGSHDSNGAHSKFSSRGREVDVLGPGEDVWSAAPGGHKAAVVEKSGTSFSGPCIAGLCALVLAYAEVAEGPALREKVSNTVVMRQLLREMATSPNHHDETEGYGCLNPMNIFRYGKENFLKLVEDILQEPRELGTSPRSQMMFAYLNKFDVLGFPLKRNATHSVDGLQKFLTEHAGPNALQQRCDAIQRESLQASDLARVEDHCPDKDFCLHFQPTHLHSSHSEHLDNFLVLFLQNSVKGRGKIKTMRIESFEKEQHLHLVENICSIFGVEELVLPNMDLAYALFRSRSQSSQENETSGEVTSEETFVSLPQNKFSIFLPCSPTEIEQILGDFDFKEVKSLEGGICVPPCNSRKVTQISLTNFYEFVGHCSFMARSYDSVLRALSFLELYKYPFGKKVQRLCFEPLDSRFYQVFSDKRLLKGTSTLWLFQPVALEEKLLKAFQEIHEACSTFTSSGEYEVERVVLPQILQVKDPMPLLTSHLLQNCKQLVFHDLLTLTDAACLAGKLQNQVEKAVFVRLLISFEQTALWGKDCSQTEVCTETTCSAIPDNVELLEDDTQCICAHNQHGAKQVLDILKKISGQLAFQMIKQKIQQILTNRPCRVVADALQPHMEEIDPGVPEHCVYYDKDDGKRTQEIAPSETHCLGRNCPCSSGTASYPLGHFFLFAKRIEPLKTMITVAIFGDGIPGNEMFVPEYGTEIAIKSDGDASKEHDGHFFANFVETEDCFVSWNGTPATSQQICHALTQNTKKALDLTSARCRILSLKVADEKSHIDPTWLYEALDFLLFNEKQAQHQAGTEAYEWPKADVLVFPYGLKHSSRKIMEKLISLMQRSKVVVAVAWRTHRGISFPACLGDVITMGVSSSRVQHEGREVDLCADMFTRVQLQQTPEGRHWPPDRFSPPSVGMMLGQVTSLIANIIHYAEEIGGRDYRRAVTNNAVMREILHRMCSDPGHHTQDKGYGQLDPQPIFDKGREYFKMMLEEIVPSLTRREFSSSDSDASSADSLSDD